MAGEQGDSRRGRELTDGAPNLREEFSELSISELRHARLRQLQARATTLFFDPVLKKYRPGADAKELAQLGYRAANALQTGLLSPRSFTTDLGELGWRICRSMLDPRVDPETTLNSAFPDEGAIRRNNFRIDACPRTFFYFVCEQIGWKAVQEGWAVCIAECGLAQRKSLTWWVGSDYFPALGDSDKVALPEELGVSNFCDLNNAGCEIVGADILQCILVSDLRELLDMAPPALGQRSGNSIQRETQAGSALAKLAESEVHARLRKDDAMAVLCEHGFSKRAAERIWAAGAPQSWRKAGAPRKLIKLFTPADFRAVLDQI